MALRFTRSASRHGISQERAAYVMNHAVESLSSPDDPEVVIWLGVDWNGIPLEIGAIEIVPGERLVVHGMPMRRKYLAQFGW